MKKLALIALGIGMVFMVMRAMTRPTLKHFTASEFGFWWPFMDADLLTKLDAFREVWGAPVKISGAKGSLGRHGGSTDHSQHNIDQWITVKAADVFPMVSDGKGGYRYIHTAEERQRAYEAALAVGFTGIGLYTDTQPGNLLHVDVRDTERTALWSRVNGAYLGINEVLV